MVFTGEIAIWVQWKEFGFLAVDIFDGEKVADL